MTHSVFSMCRKTLVIFSQRGADDFWLVITFVRSFLYSKYYLIFVSIWYRSMYSWICYMLSSKEWLQTMNEIPMLWNSTLFKLLYFTILPKAFMMLLFWGSSFTFEYRMWNWIKNFLYLIHQTHISKCIAKIMLFIFNEWWRSEWNFK